MEKKIALEKSNTENQTNVTKKNNKEETEIRSNSSNVTSSKTESKNTENKSKKEVKEVEVEEEEDEENENKIRGYKLTKDGRKTTFFNNEMDEQTKALIGSIAPQQIEGSDVALGGGVSNGGSAWNVAGTFESVDHCKKMLRFVILCVVVLLLVLV